MFTFHFSSHTLHLFCLFAPISSCFPSFFFFGFSLSPTPTPLSPLLFFFFFILPQPGAKPGIFVLGGQVATLIYLSKQPSYTYIYIHTHAHFLLYTHTHIYTLFYLISYINTPTQHQKEKKEKKKDLVLSIKVMFDDDLYKIKFIFSIFMVKFLKSFILNINYQILY